MLTKSGSPPHCDGKRSCEQTPGWWVEGEGGSGGGGGDADGLALHRVLHGRLGDWVDGLGLRNVPVDASAVRASLLVVLSKVRDTTVRDLGPGEGVGADIPRVVDVFCHPALRNVDPVELLLLRRACVDVDVAPGLTAPRLRLVEVPPRRPVVFTSRSERASACVQVGRVDFVWDGRRALAVLPRRTPLAIVFTMQSKNLLPQRRVVAQTLAPVDGRLVRAFGRLVLREICKPAAPAAECGCGLGVIVGADAVRVLEGGVDPAVLDADLMLEPVAALVDIAPGVAAP
mmetsp:Transcript_44156/g.88569  ORF Transcript_44156/g.88569 Transcript_44156/m.88569 type:complete len:287 (+) Transcript_44156:436-1296(+)